jgi:hypothetical protein
MFRVAALVFQYLQSKPLNLFVALNDNAISIIYFDPKLINGIMLLFY